MSASSPGPGTDSSRPSSSTNSATPATSRFWVIIPAAGVGSRMQSDIPKQYLKIEKQSVLARSIQVFLSHPAFDQVFVGISGNDGYFELESISSNAKVQRFSGGAERCDTVLNGLDKIASVAADSDWVWVHDAARPCLSKSDINKLIAQLEILDAEFSGAILAAKVVDTIKVSGDGKHVDGTSDRDKLWRALTPQVFRFSELRSALIECRKRGLQVTDESSALEHLGFKPMLVEGSDENLKITRPNDLRLAQGILADREKLSEKK